MLLLHGGGQTRHAWGGTGAALGRRGWHALALDLRGHGDSEWPADGDYTLEALVDDLAASLGALGRPAAVVGASLGGLTGLVAVGERSMEGISALVLVDVAPRLEPEGVSRIVEFMSARLDGFATLEEAAEAVAGYAPHRPRPASLEGLRKNLRRGEDGRWRWHWDPRLVTGELRPSASRDPDRLAAAARRVRIPTLLVRGRMSDVVSPEGVREFLELVPHAGFVDVSGAGHMVAGDDNDAFTRAVVEFLQELR